MFINNFSVRYIDLDADDNNSNNENFIKITNILLPNTISKGQARRMSNASKNAISMCHELWPFDQEKTPFSFHIGTGLAMIQDTEKFLHTLIAFKEESVSPTQFIQSTHNTIGGQLALLYNSNAHNITFSQGLNSYLDAYKDAEYRAKEFPDADILCGSIDEINELATAIYKEQNMKKSYIYTEGGAFFHLRKEANKQSKIEILCIDKFSKNTLKTFISDLDKNHFADMIFYGNNWLDFKENIGNEHIISEKNIGYNASIWAIQKAIACDLLLKSKKNQLIYLSNLNENYIILHLKKV